MNDEELVHPFRAWRERDNRSLSRVVADTGLAFGTISKIERGTSRRLANASTIAALANYTNGAVPADAFLDFHALKHGGPMAAECHPIRLWRFRRGVDMPALATRVGFPVAVNSLYVLETGTWRPNEERAQALSAATNHEVSASAIRNWRLGKRKEKEMKAEETPNLRRGTLTKPGHPHHGMVVMFARCTHCGEDKAHFPVRRHAMPPSELWHKKLSQLGWVIGSGGRKQICPDCRRARAATKVEEKETTQMANGHAEMDAPKAENPRELTPAEYRTLFRALETHFDPGRGLYRPGHSDHTLAEAYEIPVERVVELREMAFGELKVDAQLEKAERRIVHLTNYLKELKEEAMPKIETILDKITQAEAKLDEARGWLKGGSDAG